MFTDEAGSHPYPAYVQLRYRLQPLVGSPRDFFTCGGAIVHAWRRGQGAAGVNRRAGFWVVTAAHCLSTDAVYTVNMWVGGAAPNTAVSQVSPMVDGGNRPGWKLLGPQGIRLYRHPLHGDQHTNDVALVRCLMPEGEDLPPWMRGAESEGPEAVNWAALPGLPSSPPQADTQAAMIGFGFTSRDPDAGASPTLQVAAAVVQPSNFDWSPSPAERAFFAWSVGTQVISEGKVVSTCSGDSGGPLLARLPDSPAAGTVVGPLCCGFCVSPVADLRAYPSFYTRLDAYLDSPGLLYTAGLPEDSLWRRGVYPILEAHSPTRYRSVLPTEAGDQAAVPGADEQEGNVWIEAQPVAHPWWYWVMITAMFYPELTAAAAVVALLILVGVVYMLWRGVRQVKRSRREKKRGTSLRTISARSVRLLER